MWEGTVGRWVMRTNLERAWGRLWLRRGWSWGRGCGEVVGSGDLELDLRRM